MFLLNYVCLLSTILSHSKVMEIVHFKSVIGDRFTRNITRGRTSHFASGPMLTHITYVFAVNRVSSSAFYLRKRKFIFSFSSNLRNFSQTRLIIPRDVFKCDKNITLCGLVTCIYCVMNYILKRFV